MPRISDDELVAVLRSYRSEAEDARDSGPWCPRKDIWNDNIDLYFSRFDFGDKADWQSKQPMPEAALYIDRWAAALRSALVVPGQWYSIATRFDELKPAFEKFLGFYLDRCGTSPTGQPVGFPRIFEEQAKLAALMATAATVTWEERPTGGGRVRVDSVDPREVLLDPTGRGLYRIRRYERDYYQLLAEAKRYPDLYDRQQLDLLGASRAEEEEADREQLTGHGTAIGSKRKPITCDEYLATVLDSEGRDVYGAPQLVIIANERYIVRRPEHNPYWHNQDWTVFAPAITVPLSIYGKTYVETWGPIARTFVEMTNLIIDAGMMGAMNAHAIIADMLVDPSQASDGIFPNKLFLLKEGADPKRFSETLNLGALAPSAVDVWTALKQEMREGAGINDIAVGQTVPKGDVTATEINEVQKGGSALIQSIASSLETGCIDPLLNLIFQTALQHISEADDDLRRAIGDEYFQMFLTQREAFARQPPAFRAHGISGLVESGQKLRSMLQVIQAMGSSPILQQAFIGSLDFSAFTQKMLVLLGLDPKDFAPNPATTPAAPQIPAGSNVTPLPPRGPVA